MGRNSDYYKEQKQLKLKKLKELEKGLPTYTIAYLDEKELNSQISTVLSYAYDLHTFFQVYSGKQSILQKSAGKGYLTGLSGESDL